MLLALILGWAGIHQLYLGNTYRGTLMLLFFWTGIPFLLSLVDFIAYAMMGTSNFNCRYNTL